MSLVDSWPSTLIRSNDRLTVTPSSSSARLRVERRVGLHEAEHRREARRDHPGALALSATSLRCLTAASSSARHACRGRRSCGSHAAKSAAGSSPSDAARPGSAAAIRPPGSSTPMTPVEATATSRGSQPEGRGRRVLDGHRLPDPVLAGRSVRVAGVCDDGAQAGRSHARASPRPAPRARPSRRSAGADGAAPRHRRSGRRRAAPASVLDPAGDAAARNPAGEPLAVDTCSAGAHPAGVKKLSLTEAPPPRRSRTSG